MAHWTQPYVGLRYTDAQDCAWLVQKVLREQYGATVDLPQDRDWRERSERSIVREARRYAHPVSIPHEGDIVLMRVLGRARTLGTHIGVFVVVSGVGHVLHSLRGIGSVLERQERLWPRLEVTGYYRLDNAPD